MKMVLALTGMALPILSLIVGCGQQSAKPTYQEMSIPEALKKVDFKVLQPTWFPFQVTNTDAEIGTLNGQKELILAYQNKQEQKTLLEVVIDQQVTIPSDDSEKDLKLSNGDDAVYQNLGKLSVLYWWTGGASYTLQDKLGVPTSNNTKPFLTTEQLVKIADSVK